MDNTLYVLDTIFSADSRKYAGGQVVNYPHISCPTCNISLLNPKISEIEIELNHLGKDGFAVHLWNSHSLPIFREDLTDLWELSGFAGFKRKKVKITGWYKGNKRNLPHSIPTYYIIIPTHLVKLVAPSPAGSPCPTCSYVEYSFPKVGTYLANGIIIDDSTYNGVDFSGLHSYNYLFCSKRVASATLSVGYSRHISFIDTKKYGTWEDFDIRKWSSSSYTKYLESFLIREPGGL